MIDLRENAEIHLRYEMSVVVFFKISKLLKFL